jgi:hypothetical protein
VYVKIDETSKEPDKNNKPVISCQNLGRCTKHRAEGDTYKTVVARVKVRLSVAKWETIKQAVNHGGVLLQDASKDILMGYHYALHRQAIRSQQEKSEIRKRQESISAASKILREERINTSYTSGRRHHMRVS